LPETPAEPLKQLTAAALRAGLFLLMVGVITIGLIALLKARATLEAQAELYTAKQSETQPSETRLASSSTRPAMLSGSARPAVPPAAEPKTPVGELLTGSITVRPDELPITGSRDVRGAGPDEQPGEFSDADAGKGENGRLVTITIHRGRNPASAYTVPRE
jgi:hypothetical protein